LGVVGVPPTPRREQTAGNSPFPHCSLRKGSAELFKGTVKVERGMAGVKA